MTNFLWRLRELQEFIDQVYLPTVYLVASAYKDYLSIGAGCKNFLCYGLFDLDDEGSQKLFPAGVFVLDEGVGVHVVRELKRSSLPPSVELIEAGTMPPGLPLSDAGGEAGNPSSMR